MKLSVITVCFNAASAIARTIESFLEQDYRDSELLVVDGASPDGTASIARSFGDPRIMVTSEADEGIYDAMNKGLARFSGDAAGFLNADDTFADPGTLSAIASTSAAAAAVLNTDDTTTHNARAVLTARSRK